MPKVSGRLLTSRRMRMFGTKSTSVAKKGANRSRSGLNGMASAPCDAEFVPMGISDPSSCATASPFARLAGIL